MSTTWSVPASPDHEQSPDLLVIPARWASTRLPGKPLVEIAGRALIDRVVDVARRAAALAERLDVLVATDDERIADRARALGCEVAMTDPAIGSGSARAHAAASGRAPAPAPAIVVNLQGDAPFVAPATIAALIGALRESPREVATPVARLGWDALDRLREHKRDAPFSGTTCTRLPDGRALWFSKAIIPAIRDEAGLRARAAMSPVHRHLGVYAYRLHALARFEATAPTPYEQLEGLEQLRFLESGVDILTVLVEAPRHDMGGIDTPEDVALAERLIARLGDPYGG